MAIGYACITLGLNDSGMQGCTLKNAKLERLHEITGNNLKNLDRQLLYNASHGISLFRISSDVIPFGSHPAVHYSWWTDYADVLAELGEKIKKQEIRVSMHPGQFTVLNAQDPGIAARAAADLEYHARFLDSLGLDARHKIILHVGGVYGDAVSSLNRFKHHYLTLPQTVKRRLVLENDEKYHIGQVLQLAGELEMPVVFDVFHHACYPAPGKTDRYQWLERCHSTWKPADGVQKIHYSQQEAGLRSGAHARSIQLKPFLDFYQHLPMHPLDIMLECKDKDLSAIKCQLAVSRQIEKRQLEQEWARYKYLVMEHSPQHDEAIGRYISGGDVNAQAFYYMIEEALGKVPTPGQVFSVAQHVWGYFRQQATTRERKDWEERLAQFTSGKTEKTRLKDYLHRLACKYSIDYLLESYYFLQ